MQDSLIKIASKYPKSKFVFIEGKFAPGTYELGIKENGIDLSQMQYTIESVPPDVLEFLSNIRKEIIAGSIQVPKNEEEYKEFEPLLP